MAFFSEMPLHDGEERMRAMMKVPDLGNPMVPAMSPQLSNHLPIVPLIAIGTVDAEGRPWTTLWGNGDRGFARPLGGGIVGIRTPVAGRHDPVVEALVGKEASGKVVKEEGQGRMIGGLTLDLEARKRTKMFGRMVAGALSAKEDEVADTQEHVAEVQLVLKIEQSIGNCPKYLNKKHIVPASAKPELVSDSPKLHPKAIELVAKADLFFISSSNHDQDMDTNYRGGPPGFMRVASNEERGAVVVYPEYSGNRLYQTLGNLVANPVAGLCVPDLETGDMLYLTGHSEVLVGQEAADLLPRSNLGVKVTISSARFVAAALPFRGVVGDYSPYNPAVRYLASEKTPALTDSRDSRQATLLSQTKLSPNVSRFKFSLPTKPSYTAGQYVTLDFSSHLDVGYSHMRDDDPQSLNDDFVRTFTVSSAPHRPNDASERPKEEKQFEITIRKVGVATEFLFRHAGKEKTDREELEIDVKGFGGEFEVQQSDGEAIAFIAGGVGITPLLPCLRDLDLSRLRVFWSVRQRDVSFVLDTLQSRPGLQRCLVVFITDVEGDGGEEVCELKDEGVTVLLRRVEESDLVESELEFARYYLCTAVAMRRQLMEWLPAEKLVFEDFNF